jgi:hypothetical protein
MGLAASHSVGSLLASEYLPMRIGTTSVGACKQANGIGYVLAARGVFREPQ